MVLGSEIASEIARRFCCMIVTGKQAPQDMSLDDERKNKILMDIKAAFLSKETLEAILVRVCAELPVRPTFAQMAVLRKTVHHCMIMMLEACLMNFPASLLHEPRRAVILLSGMTIENVLTSQFKCIRADSNSGSEYRQQEVKGSTHPDPKKPLSAIPVEILRKTYDRNRNDCISVKDLKHETEIHDWWNSAGVVPLEPEVDSCGQEEAGNAGNATVKEEEKDERRSINAKTHRLPLLEVP